MSTDLNCTASVERHHAQQPSSEVQQVCVALCEQPQRSLRGASETHSLCAGPSVLCHLRRVWLRQEVSAFVRARPDTARRSLAQVLQHRGQAAVRPTGVPLL